MTEKFISSCPPPTPYERELLEILIEECAEVQQRATKALRFGLAEIQPGQPHDNAYRLGLEIGDVKEVVRRLNIADIISRQSIVAGVDNKRSQLARFMQTSPDPSPNCDTEDGE